MIKSVADAVPVKQPKVSFNAPLAITSTPFSESRDFSWNVEKAISTTMSFTYYVGEGPLYWFRIEWAEVSPLCTASSACQDIVPTISYIAPNCPYEIIENCIIFPPICDCKIPCEGKCMKKTTEIWHMLATSVTHLCERINQECCNTKPTAGMMKSVKQYMRPALCCDVAKFGADDEYVEVDILKCECGNLVHPCVGTFIYPCHINRCGIFGPAYEGGPVPPISEIKMAPNILGHMPIPIMTHAVSTNPEMQLVAPKAIQPINKIVNKYGTSLPELIRCNHNLSDFIKPATKFDSLDLFYNKETNSWHGSKSFKEWKAVVEWIPAQDSTKNYKINVSFEKGGKKSKVSLLVKNETFFEKGVFEVKCNFNCGSGTLNSKKSVLQSKLIKDDMGLFKNLKDTLKINLRG